MPGCIRGLRYSQDLGMVISYPQKQGHGLALQSITGSTASPMRPDDIHLGLYPYVVEMAVKWERKSLEVVKERHCCIVETTECIPNTSPLFLNQNSS